VRGVGNIGVFNDSICGKSSGSESCNVVVDWDVRPVLSQDGAAVGLDFAEGDGSHSGSFEPEAESSDPGKEVKNAHVNG
jgi:hypothetical protein